MEEDFLSLDKASKDEIRFIFFKECKEKDKATRLTQHAIVAAYKNNTAALEQVLEFYTRHPGCLNFLFQFYKELIDKKRKDFVISFIQQLIDNILKFYKVDFTRDVIDSSYESNLPFLRTLFYLGTLYHTSQNFNKAIETYEKLITLDPEDLIGTRYALMRIYLRRNMYKRILQLCNKYSDDETPIIMYGQALALIKEGEVERGKQVLKEAIRLHPIIAWSILEDRQENINKERKFILPGGNYEAALYMQYYKEFWDEKSKEVLREFQDEILRLVEKKKEELKNEDKILDALENIRKNKNTSNHKK